MVQVSYCCGVILFSKDLSHVLLVESKRKGNYGFPKGRKEPEDGWSTWIQTAFRELREETSLVPSEQPITFSRLLHLPQQPYAFVEDLVKKRTFECHCRYAIGVYLEDDYQSLKLQPLYPEEILSVGWIPIDSPVLRLRPRPVVIALIHRALDTMKVYDLSVA